MLSQSIHTLQQSLLKQYTLYSTVLDIQLNASTRPTNAVYDIVLQLEVYNLFSANSMLSQSIYTLQQSVLKQYTLYQTVLDTQVNASTRPTNAVYDIVLKLEA